MATATRGLLFGLGLLLSVPALAERTLTLGILAFEPPEVAHARWQPLIDRLDTELDGVRIEGVLASYGELNERLRNNELDFLLTNPSHFIRFRSESSLSGALATLVPVRRGRAVRGFGGVAFARAERDDLNDWADIPGQRVAAVLEASLGGYQAQAIELLERGLALPNSHNLRFVGMPHDGVVEAVLTGEADVGFVRVGVLERLMDDGALARDSLRIIGEQTPLGYPFALSTRLYPEWPLISLNQVDRDIGRRLLVALLALDADDPAARAAGIAGFSVPMDYEPVERLARTLRLPPYDVPQALRWEEFWELYRIPLVLLGLALFGLAAMAVGLYLAIRRRYAIEAEQAAARRFRDNLLVSLGEGVFGIDGGGRFTFLNPTACRLLGFASEAEALGLNSHTTSHHTRPDGSPFPEQECPIHRVLRSGEPVEAWQDTFWSRDGSAFPVLVYAAPLYGEGQAVEGAVVSFQDISEQRRAEQARAALTEELSRSNAELEQFAYAISHDMRQPLRMVNGYLQLLERSLGTALDEEQRHFFDYAVDGARRMDAMIVGLLEYSRVGRKTAPPAPLATREALDTALAFLRPAMEEGGAEVAVKGEWPQWVASHDEMVRLFQNLIGNAVKYVAPGTHPVITVVSGVVEGDWVVEVRDNGIGIDPAQRERLFQVFSRLHTRDEYEGSGIGLALCRRIVEHHGGTIEVESEGDGRGSTFRFRIPKAQATEEGDGG